MITDSWRRYRFARVSSSSRRARTDWRFAIPVSGSTVARLHVSATRSASWAKARRSRGSAIRSASSATRDPSSAARASRSASFCDAPVLVALDDQRIPRGACQRPDEGGNKEHGGSGNLDVQRTSREQSSAACAPCSAPRYQEATWGCPELHGAMVPPPRSGARAVPQRTPAPPAGHGPKVPCRRNAGPASSAYAARRPPSQTASIRSGSVSKSNGSPADEHEVGELAGLDRAELLVHAQQLGGAPRGRLEHRRRAPSRPRPSARARAGSGRAA